MFVYVLILYIYLYLYYTFQEEPKPKYKENSIHNVSIIAYTLHVLLQQRWSGILLQETHWVKLQDIHTYTSN